MKARPKSPMRALAEHLARLEDPRVERSRVQTLLAVLTMAICGVICGAESGVEIAEFGRTTADWFATFRDLPQGMPAHDTFGRVFARLDARQFAVPPGCGRWRRCCRPR